MKKTIYLFGMAALALAFTACNKKEEDTSLKRAGDMHYATVTLGKDVDTKTTVVEGEGIASYRWCENDDQYLKIYENGVIGEIQEFTLNSDKTKATLVVAFPNTSKTKFLYEARYAKDVSKARNPLVQAEQSPSATSFDPEADVLVSSITDSVTTRLTNFSLDMGRPVTVNKMTLTGLEAGEVISSVEFTLDQHMVGYISYNKTEQKFECNNGGKKITITYPATAADGVVPSNGQFPVYFISAPVTESPIVSVVVNTNKNVYTKIGNANEGDPFYGKTISFAVGQMTRFTMDLTGFGKPISAGTPYTLVESQADLVDGASYIIVANYVANEQPALKAMSVQNNNNRAVVDVTATDKVITIDNTVAANVFTIAADEGYYTIKDITEGATSYNQYLYAASKSSNQLKSTSTVDDKARWTIAITNGIASITCKASDVRGVMCYNSGSTIISCYNELGSYYTLSLYVDKGTTVELEDPGLAFNAETATGVYGKESSFDAPTLINPHNLSITWSSSDEKVATIDADGSNLKFVGDGTTTITAASAKTSVYSAGSASYELTVSGTPAPPTGKGETADNPFTPEEAVTFIQGLSSTPTDKEYYVEGIVTRIVNNGQFEATHGNATFFISEDGTTSSQEFEAYRVLYLGNRKWQEGDLLIGVGDEVIVCGRLTKYTSSNNTVTYETYAQTGDNAYNGYLYSLEKAPYFTPTLSANTIGSEGGDLTLTISANTAWTVSINGGATLGTPTAAPSASVSGNSDAEVTVHIPANNTSAAVTYTISMNPTGVAAPNALTITQAAQGEAAKGTENNPYTASEAYEAATTTAVADVYVKGIVSAITTAFNSQFNNVSYTLSDDGSTEGNQFTVYRGAAEDATTVAVGDGMIVKGSLIKYNGTKPEFEAGAVIQSKVRMPAFESGDIGFTTSTTVTLSAETGVSIHYTTDGTNPTTESSVYSAALYITETTTVKAIAVKDGLVSGIASKTFTKAVSYPVTFTQPAQTGCSFTVSVGGENITSGTMVPQNTVVTLTATAGTGYGFSSWTVTGATVSSSSSATATFTMGTSAVSISATFTELEDNSFTKYSGAITEGDYLIVYDGKAMNNTVDKNRLQYETVTPSNDVITTTNAAIIWHIEASGDYWTIYSEDAEKYAAGNGTKNQAALNDSGTDDASLWTVTGTETYEFVNKKNAASNVNSNLRNNGTYGFACYSTSTGGALTLYKKN